MGARLQLFNAVGQLAGSRRGSILAAVAIPELIRAVLQGGDSIHQLLRAVGQIIASILQGIDTVAQRLRAVRVAVNAFLQTFRAALQPFHSLLQGIHAALQILRAVRKLVRRITDLSGLIIKVIQRKHFFVHVQIHGKALEADGVHLKIQHVRRHRDILLASGQNAVNQLFIRSHICRGRAGRLQIAASFHVHGQRYLEQIIFKKFGIHLVILSHMNGYPELSILSGKFFGAYFFSVQRIADGNLPGDFL